MENSTNWKDVFEIISFIASCISIISIFLAFLFFWIPYRSGKRHEKIMETQGEIINRLNIFQSAIAETQLREKITVMKGHIKEFKIKPDNDKEFHPEDKIDLLIGDCMAALPLFELAPEKTQAAFLETALETWESLESKYVFNPKAEQPLKFKNKFRKILIEHSITHNNENSESERNYRKLLSDCGFDEINEISLD